MRKRFGPCLALLVALVFCPVLAHAQAARPRAGDEVAGLSRERLARIGPVMREQIDKGIFPGAVTLVARRGTIVHHEAHGYLDAARTRPMTRDAIFRLASM
ncbi:MAG TPA: serine hydrolase, partial [Calidithermus sp.]|nr:serine hydrolase [Calidithermus sp.]